MMRPPRGIRNNNPGFPLEIGTDATNGNGAHVTTAGIFTDLTRAWVATRYAGEPPDAGTFEELCRRFTPVFGAPA